MLTINEFTEHLQNEKKEVFKNFICEYEANTQGKNYWDGSDIKIEEQQDVYIYLSEDKKTLSTSYGDYDPNQDYSYMIYLCHYFHIAKYTNGCLQFIGFYNNTFEKVKVISIDKLKIIGCGYSMSFKYIRYPEFWFELEHEYGNKHNSIRGAALRIDTCQKALDSIWSIEKFYEDFWTRFNNSPEN